MLEESVLGKIKEFIQEILEEEVTELLGEEVQEDLDKWLEHYNYERPHRGYRSMGKRPIETIESGKLIREQMLKEAA